MELKTCSKCNAVKPATLKYFFKHRVNTFGNILLKGRCKDCCRTKSKERERQLSKQYYERNKEEIKKKRREQYALKKQGVQISP